MKSGSGEGVRSDVNEKNINEYRRQKVKSLDQGVFGKKKQGKS